VVPPVSDRTPAEIEREMEATRQRLASTIDQLAYRAKPSTIASRQVADIKAYFVAPDGSPRTDNILKVAGGVVGVVAAMVLLRKITR
jgi:hypothetical protein